MGLQNSRKACVYSFAFLFFSNCKVSGLPIRAAWDDFWSCVVSLMAKQHQNDASAQRSCPKRQTLVTDMMSELYRRYTAKLSEFSTVSQEDKAAQLKKNRKTTCMWALGVYNVQSASRARRCLQKRRLDHSPRLADCNRGPFFTGLCFPELDTSIIQSLLAVFASMSPSPCQVRKKW